MDFILIGLFMTPDQFRDYLLDRVANGQAARSSDFPKTVTPYTVKKVIKQLTEAGSLVTRVLPGGKIRLYFKDVRAANSFLREYSQNMTPVSGAIAFDKNAIVVQDHATVISSLDAKYAKLSPSHVSGSGYRTSF